MAEHLELPRPARLLRTTAWNLGESIGFPVAAMALGAWLAGRDAGLLAGLGATWLTAIVRKVVTGSVPGLLGIMAIVLTVQTALVIATGDLWIFLLHFPLANLCLFLLFAMTARSSKPLCARLATEMIALRQPETHHPGLHRFFQRATWLWAGIFLLLAGTLTALLVTETAKVFLLLTTVATVALLGVGVTASLVWFWSVMRRHGLRLRFAAA